MIFKKSFSKTQTSKGDFRMIEDFRKIFQQNSDLRKITGKRAQEASTLVWIGASFVILLILVLYFVFTAVLFINKGNTQVKVEKEGGEDLSLLREHLMLLKSPPEQREFKLESFCSDYQLIIPGEEILSEGSLKVHSGQLEGQIAEIEPSYLTSFIKVLYKDKVQYSTYKKSKTC